MLSFFRINDPFRLLILIIAILLIRLPYLIGSEPLLYELEWLTIGENLTNSGTILYKDFLSSIAPLSALVYTGISYLFGKSVLPLHLLAILVLAFQIALFNNIMYKNKAYNENTYIPAFIYALLMQAFFDFYTLSPVFISLTFILLVLDNIYLRIENKLDDFTILKTGIYMGLAVLFYLPAFIFVVATILSFALLTSLIFRRYLLFLYGFLIPLFIVGIYYLLNGALSDLIHHWILYTFTSTTENILNTPSFLIIIGLPTLLLIISVYRTFTFSRFTNYQVRVQQVMFIMFLAAWACWIFSNNKAPYQLLIFVPFISFFVGHFILLMRNKFKAELVAICFSFLTIFISYYIFYNGTWVRGYSNFYKLSNYTTIYDNWVENKSRLVLADDKSIYYQDNLNAGKYFDWPVSKEVWENSDQPQNLSEIYDYLSISKPETIIDPQALMPKIFEQLPQVKNRYRKVSAQVYQLRDD